MKLTSSFLSSWLLLLSVATTVVVGYEVTSAGDITLTDVDTEISGLRTVFLDEPTGVTLTGVAWNETDDTVTEVTFETFVNGKSAATGTVEITDGELPDTIDAGVVYVKDRGTAKIRVEITSGSSSADTSASFQAFGNGVAIIPLLVVLGLAVTTRMVRSIFCLLTLVFSLGDCYGTCHLLTYYYFSSALLLVAVVTLQVEFSLFAAIFVGSCMIEGTIIDGFKQTLETYLLTAVADEDHGYVVLFSLFLSYVSSRHDFSLNIFLLLTVVLTMRKSSPLSFFFSACLLTQRFGGYDGKVGRYAWFYPYRCQVRHVLAIWSTCCLCRWLLCFFRWYVRIYYLLRLAVRLSKRNCKITDV